MHCRELADFAAAVAVQGPVRVCNEELLDGALSQYWSASQTRAKVWTAALSDPSGMSGTELRSLLEEILVSEILTRVWIGAACTCTHSSNGRLQSVARRVYELHVSARHLALCLLLENPKLHRREAADLDSIRRRCERWSDLLLGYLVPPPVGTALRLVPQEFAFERERTEEFARDLAEDRQAGRPLTLDVMRASLRAAFRESLSEHVPNAALNRKIAFATIRCFSIEPPPPPHVPRILWLERMADATDHTEGLIQELLSLHAP